MRIILHVLTVCLIATFFPAIIRAEEDTERYLRTPVPEQWIYTGIEMEAFPSDTEWWKSFADPTLDSLIHLGMERNLNVSQTMRRIEMARLSLSSAKSSFYPSIGVNAGYARTKSHNTEANVFSLGAKMNWEIDLFGKINSQVKAGKAALDLSRAEYRGAMLAMTAEIATYYINYRIYQTELEVARMHLESQGQVLKITEARHEAGLVSKLDVAQARVVYGNTEVTIPQIEASIKETFNALAILIGEYPETLTFDTNRKEQLPTIYRIIPAGVPMNLLRRRPDIAQAEATLAGYAAQIGIAKKDFLPTLSLEGSIGVESEKADKLFDSGSLSYSIGPTLSWSLFEGMGRKYALARARQQMEAGIDNYNLVVMNAVEEVNNALLAYSAAVKTVEMQRHVLQDSHETFTLSLDLYTQGLTAFTNVENAQINWLNCANAIVASQGDALVALIDLYKALGGSPQE